jgi:thiol-disulfide isomerase/thioredoxin
LKNVDGKKLSLADFKEAKGFIVIFDCNTCPVSQAYNNRIIALNKKYASQGFPVVAINPNDPTVSPGDSFERMVSYAKKKGFEHPYLVDETQEVTRSFGATNTPHVYILSKELKVLYVGAIDNSMDEQSVTKKYVESALDELLSGKGVTTTKTKAVGCTIKWKNS